MSVEIKVPLLPESVPDATMLRWHVKKGQQVRRDENLVDIETEKVVLEVPAPQDGVISEILYVEGDTVLANDVIAIFDDSGTAVETSSETTPTDDSDADSATLNAVETITPADPPEKLEAHLLDESEKSPSTGAAGPAAKHAAAETGIDLAQVSGTGPRGRILKQDVLVQSRKSDERAPVGQEREPRREPMSRLRRTIAGRLVNAQHEAAILTTFNEVDLHEIKTIRARYKETFEKTHGARLGFMSFFVKACAEALKRYPIINASVDENDILFHDYYDIGIAVSSPRGLVVPVLRDAQKQGLAEIELAITEFGDRARNGNLGMDDLSGGTFTITNGGVFGSMLSTPILNPPQSAILGMHKIQDRPVALNGEVVIRPMMYIALSYDHRIIDGADAVSFLVAVKETLEDPARLLLEL
ncbi:2-oxoglutarate dehydrogenase complex dihydrolipoyllysine-residue succinyltransferase [Arenicellales bacterium nBUS_48]